MADSDAESFASALDDFDDSQVVAPAAEPAAGAPAATATDAATEVGAAKDSANSEEDGVPQAPYPLHRACWNGQTALVRRLAAGLGKEQFKELDGQGNTALHIAVMRRRPACVAALLEAGCPAGPRNTRGWVPLMEAVELGDKPLALQLARAEVAQMRQAVKSKKAALLGLLRTQLPDFSLQIKWELGSGMPGVGALVRRYAPHDTYTLWKKGGRIRVDGSLMGVDESSTSLVPGWKRGHFSLLYDASGDKAKSVFVNHTKKTWIDVKAARKKLGVDEGAALEAEVDMLMTSEVLQHKKLKSVDFRFKPVAGWLSKEVREKVEGWNTRLYEAAGRMVAISRYKMPYGLAPTTTFDQYLAATYEPDPVVESAVNPLNPASLKDRGMNPAKAAAKAAVAAMHQCIAAAAAQAEDERAATVAAAAAARAAAGAMRALAPRIDVEDDDDEEAGQGGGEGEGDEELDRAAAELAAAELAEANGDGEKGAKGKKGNGSSSKKKLGTSGSSGFSGMFKMQSAGGAGSRKSAGGAATAADGGGTVVHATAAADADGASPSPPPPPPAASPSKPTALSTGGNGGGTGAGAGDAAASAAKAMDVNALLKEDLTAWAAQVAADAAKANGGAAADGDGDDEQAAAAAAAWRSGGGAGPGPGSSSSAAVAASMVGKTSVSSGGGGSSSSMFGSWGFGKKKEGGGAAPPPAPSTGAGTGTGAGAGGGSGAPGVSAAVVKKSRKITGRCWMAESFPISLNQLLPLLEVVGTANKAFAKVARFMRKYGDLGMFPVKVQIPLLLTVYMMLSFKQFTLLDSSSGSSVGGGVSPAAAAAAAAASAASGGKGKGGKDNGGGPHSAPAPDDSFFEIPEGYTQGKLEDESARGMRQGGDGQEEEEEGEEEEEEEAEGGEGSGDGDGEGDGGKKEKGEAGEGASGSKAERGGAKDGSDLETVESLRASQFKMKKKKQQQQEEKKKRKDGGDEGPSLRLLKGTTEDDEMGLGGLDYDD